MAFILATVFPPIPKPCVFLTTLKCNESGLAARARVPETRAAVAPLGRHDALVSHFPGSKDTEKMSPR